MNDKLISLQIVIKETRLRASSTMSSSKEMRIDWNRILLKRNLDKIQEKEVAGRT
jgi:hypothetical protein